MPLRLARLLVAPLLLGGLLLSACDDEPPMAEEAVRPGALASAEDEDTESGYRVYLSDAVVDTLTGRSSFQVLYDPPTERLHFVLEMRGNTAVSGLYLSRHDTSRPAPGTYPIVSYRDTEEDPEAETTDDPQAFKMIYRAGMRRELFSETGEITIETSSDTLMTGTLRATLGGIIVRQAGGLGERPQQSRVELVGSFRAVPDETGFVVGF